jgi:hypothetical protein
VLTYIAEVGVPTLHFISFALVPLYSSVTT